MMAGECVCTVRVVHVTLLVLKNVSSCKMEFNLHQIDLQFFLTSQIYKIVLIHTVYLNLCIMHVRSHAREQ